MKVGDVVKILGTDIKCRIIRKGEKGLFQISFKEGFGGINRTVFGEWELELVD